ncbi:MAG: o-succinylbenzoate--CoA ligase [Candidatus Aminicenantes bacterium]|nr:o-succinylbenzoate--CoA ligase [Candidatus Aminicenantes bacterium]NIM80596.1 o-succinylbenzoate--CoA ligase [Candidatus Aminicenantes bacterium]NIN19977.1 o-succinylbenzoate--CoA ligase [Candidatus Aminicenantes bacterium]NIN42605.1 o-succinylbenzoate--CoA ligase [Candidatus Aminicenantes bacterium]NIN86603.1 o-succinylbenzoate--CoA ligase [Candidatus Aminicenantes bacterium]
MISCPISRYAESAPDEPAIITGERIYSYLHLNRIISSTADHLKQKGVGKGARAALVGLNSSEYIAVLWALWRIGAVAVPINFRFPSEYLKKVFQKTNISFAILNFPTFSYFRERLGIIAWEEIADGREQACLFPGNHSKINLENDAAIVLTSGSTCGEKAVLHTFANHYYNALGSNENITLAPGDRWLLSLPLFHVGGLGILFRCFLAGAAVVVPRESESFLESIEKYNVTHVSLVSTQLYRLLQKKGEPRRTRRDAKKDKKLYTLKALLLGGSAFPVSLIRQAISSKLPIHITYGLTEMASQVTTTPEHAPLEKLLTSGKLLNYRSLKIDENNEICVKGKTLFKGYVEGQTLSRLFDPEGWFRTGDLGSMDAEGYLHVLGRRDNMFISGGENIMPEEIEMLLNQLPGVNQSIVVPMEDETYGFRPAAFLKPEHASMVTKDEVLNPLQKHLPGFKIPDFFYLWPDVNGSGEKSVKVDRRYFQDLLKEPEGLTLLFRK